MCGSVNGVFLGAAVLALPRLAMMARPISVLIPALNKAEQLTESRQKRLLLLNQRLSKIS
jgi:hypothetical protein